MVLHVLSLIISLSVADSAFYRPSPAEYEETKRIALHLAKEYQEDTHEIISIGRSPTSIVAFLKNLKINNIMILPLSEMNVFERVNDVNKYNKAFSYFDSMLPVQKKKKLIFMDFSVGGKSYLAQKNLIESYFKAHHADIKFEFIALVSEMDEKLKQKFSADSIKTISLNSKSRPPYGPLLWDAIFNGTYEGFAPFKKFAPWRDTAPEGNNLEFEKFRLLVKKEMMKDSEIFCRFVF